MTSQSDASRRYFAVLCNTPQSSPFLEHPRPPPPPPPPRTYQNSKIFEPSSAPSNLRSRTFKELPKRGAVSSPWKKITPISTTTTGWKSRKSSKVLLPLFSIEKRVGQNREEGISWLSWFGQGTSMVLTYMGAFLGFVGLLALASIYPFKSLWITIVFVGSVVCTSMTVFYAVNQMRLRSRERNVTYKPNAGNTILILLIAVALFTCLYALLWYPQLRTDILVTSADTVSSVAFPSIAIFQKVDWTSQPHLLGHYEDNAGSKCYLGWYNDEAPGCASLNPNMLGNNTSCTCKENWYDEDRVLDFFWQESSYRYIVFNSPEWLISNTPTYLLLLQTFFDYNSTQSKTDSSTRLSPSLYIAIYDPKLGLQEALETGYTRMNLIEANGIVDIDLGLRFRKTAHVSAFDYTLGISSIPALDLVCDTGDSGSYQYPCRLSLMINIPSFERTIITVQKLMSWLDVAASAGAYFSFVQFVGWVVSDNKDGMELA